MSNKEDAANRYEKALYLLRDMRKKDTGKRNRGDNQASAERTKTAARTKDIGRNAASELFSEPKKVDAPEVTKARQYAKDLYADDETPAPKKTAPAKKRRGSKSATPEQKKKAVEDASQYAKDLYGGDGMSVEKSMKERKPLSESDFPQKKQEPAAKPKFGAGDMYKGNSEKSYQGDEYPKPRRIDGRVDGLHRPIDGRVDGRSNSRDDEDYEKPSGNARLFKALSGVLARNSSDGTYKERGSLLGGKQIEGRELDEDELDLKTKVYSAPRTTYNRNIPTIRAGAPFKAK